MPPKSSALYVLAHQDDEYGCIAQIRRDVATGRRVIVVYLTNGTSNVGEAVRTAESRAVLVSLGVQPDDVIVLGARFGVPCLQLPEHLVTLYPALRSLAESFPPPDHITTCAWEGGHPDHDAVHLAATRLACELGIPRLREVALYNAFRRPGPFFRVLSFCDGARVGADAGPRLPLGEALGDALICRRYPSQRMTWVGLFPGAFVRLMLRRRHAVRDVLAGQPRGRPHAGRLYYERRWGIAYERFRELVAPFSAEEGAPGGG
jgi:hypothetical protein